MSGKLEIVGESDLQIVKKQNHRLISSVMSLTDIGMEITLQKLVCIS